MAEPFIGEIKFVGFNFAPNGWALCDGQLLPISQNTALFSLLGTQFGGNGQTTFALPDLRGRVPVHQGNGPGLTPRSIGEVGGQESVALGVAQLPPHSHGAYAASGDQSTDRPGGAVPARGGVYSTASPDAQLSPQAIGPTGGGQPFATQPPFLVGTFIIALVGIYPSRP
jgi:microcystin-dependent protein